MKRSDEEWKAIDQTVKQYRESGMTRDAACKKVGIASSVYHDHVKRLGLGGYQPRPRGPYNVKVKRKAETNGHSDNGGNGFTKFVPEHAAPTLGTIHISLPTGVTISVKDAAALENIMGALSRSGY